MKIRNIFAVLLVSLLTGCFIHAPHHRPAALTALAAQFKAKAGGDRIAEGKKIAALLPGYRENPFGPQRPWWLFGAETGDAPPGPDYDHPSYKLSAQEFYQVMGQPDRFKPLMQAEVVHTAIYDLGLDEKGDGFGLFVGSYNGLIIHGGVADTNIPIVQAIEFRRNPYGSTNVTTYYIKYY